MQVESHADAHESEIPSLNESPCPSEASHLVVAVPALRRGGRPQDGFPGWSAAGPRRAKDCGAHVEIRLCGARAPDATHAQEVRGRRNQTISTRHRGFCFGVRFGTEEEAVKALEAGALSAGEGESAMRGRRRRVRRGDRQTREARPRGTNTRKSTVRVPSTLWPPRLLRLRRPMTRMLIIRTLGRLDTTTRTTRTRLSTRRRCTTPRRLSTHAMQQAQHAHLRSCDAQ